MNQRVAKWCHIETIRFETALFLSIGSWLSNCLFASVVVTSTCSYFAGRAEELSEYIELSTAAGGFDELFRGHPPKRILRQHLQSVYSISI